jgi:uncharacterized damage-inducible protein DinB
VALPEVETGSRYLLEGVDAVVATTDGLNAEGLNWRPAPETNSVVVLASHVLGMVEQSILTLLCGQPPRYRNRDEEFAAMSDSSRQFAERWQALRAEIESAMEPLTRADLDRTIRHPARGEMTGSALLTMTLTHVYEHKVHAELTRQLFEARG